MTFKESHNRIMLLSQSNGTTSDTQLELLSQSPPPGLSPDKWVKVQTERFFFL